MEKVRLQFKSVSEIVGSEEMCLLILTDMEEQRQLTLFCDHAMAVQIELRVKIVPITEIMLPEVFSNLLGAANCTDMMLYISNIIDGQYKVGLYHPFSQEPIPIRASDAVLLSIASGIPLYIDRFLMAQQSMKYYPNTNGISLPINTMSNEMISKALERAIEEENYEIASHLRDEQRRRNNRLSSTE